MDQNPMMDRSARALERYNIGEWIGGGMSADVYRASEIATGRDFVIKQMIFDDKDKEESSRIIDEISVMVGTDHPNIVRFHESFRGNTSVNIVTERCEYSLEDLIERQKLEGKPFPKEVLIEWMAELLCGLEYLHSRRIIHRDIKTGNVFVSKMFHLKLGDFGVSKMLTRTTALASSMIGTPLYFAPEVCNEEAYDIRSDVWSLGVVFYEMCTLRHPFESDNLFALLNKIQYDRPAPFNTDLDEQFERIVFAMLAKKPHERPTAKQLIEEYLDVPRSHPSHPTQAPARGRAIQEYYGPTLNYSHQSVHEAAGLSTTKNSTKLKNSYATQDATWVDHGTENGPNQSKNASMMSSSSTRSYGASVRSSNAKSVTSPSACVKAPARKSTVAEKTHVVPSTASSPASPKGRTLTRPTSSSLGKKVSSETGGKMLTEEERTQSIHRIKKAKSKINMAEIRKDASAKGGSRSEITVEIRLPSELQAMLKSADGNGTGSDPNSSPLAAGSSPKSGSGESGKRSVRGKTASCTVEVVRGATSPTSPKDFSGDVEDVLNRHANGGVKVIPLKDLESAMESILKYKTDHYGYV